MVRQNTYLLNNGRGERKGNLLLAVAVPGSLFFKAEHGVAIDAVTLSGTPSKLTVTAYGVAPRLRFKSKLFPNFYKIPPVDGMLDFEFIAIEPPVSSLNVIETLKADYVIENPPVWLRGVRVHDASYSKEVLLEDLPGKKGKVYLHDSLTDEGVECEALRTDSNELYTLGGNLKKFQVGEKVFLSGTVAEGSFCMQGITIAKDTIDTDWGIQDPGVPRLLPCGPIVFFHDLGEIYGALSSPVRSW